MGLDTWYGARREGDYYIVDPSSRHKNSTTKHNWLKYISRVGHGEDQLLDTSNKDWRTTYRTFSGDDFRRKKHNFTDLHKQHFTGRQRTSASEWEKYNEDNLWTGHGDWALNEHEVLDWGAYNRDNIYASALDRRHGRRTFNTLQHILDAEDVISGRWKPEPAPPPPAPKPQPSNQPKHIDIEAQLKALGIEHEKAIGGWRDQLAEQTEAYKAQQAGWDMEKAAWDQQTADWTSQFAQQQLKYETDLAAQLDKQRGLYESQLAIQGQQSSAELDQWQTQAAEERKQYAQQLEQAGLQSAQQIEQLKATFAQQQEASRLSAQEERAQLESQLQTRYTEQWNRQQQDLTSKYEGLLNEAKTDAESARIKQAQQFEQRQLDQQAGWNKQAQEWTTKDRLYQSQLGELKGQLGAQEGLYAGLKTQYGDLQTSSSAERQALQSQLMGVQESSSLAIGQLEDRFGKAKEDWSKQQQAYIQQIGDVTGQVSNLQSAVKRNEELAMQNAERARVSASYGSQGQPVNQKVKGVRTLNELTPVTQRYGGTTGAFNRKGLRIKNLNI